MRTGQYDTAWKDIIKRHFASFLQFYFPALAGHIDLDQKPEFLEKELARLAPKNSSPHRYADLLVRVRFRSEGVRLLLCHVEVQGRREKHFEARLFQYAYRIYDRLESFPLTLVVLTDDDSGFLPAVFEDVLPVRTVRVEFLVAKLLYWKGREAELERSENPFALVTLAQLEVNALNRRRVSGNAEQPSTAREQLRFELKKRLVLKLLGKGYEDRFIWSLLTFLGWMVQLPEELEDRLDGEVNEETGGRVMPYMTRWERRGLEKGRKSGFKDGLLKEKRRVLMRQLDKKFGLTDEERDLIGACENLEALDAALDTILFAESKEEVLAHLR